MKHIAQSSPGRTITALLVGMAGCVTVWVLQPLNNFLLGNSFISDTYLPELVVGIMAVLVLVVNVLFYWRLPGWALNRRQLAIIFGMMLMAAVPTQVLRIYPHSLARGTMEAAKDPKLVELHRAMDLPDALYLDPVVLDQETPVSEQLFDELKPGNTIPWSSWLGPLLGWGSLIGASWIMMIGLGLVVFPQWRHKERMSFPLLAVQEMLIETPAPGTRVPPLFRNPLFWTAVTGVALVHAFNGLNHHTGGAVPPFPVHWDLRPAFSQGLFRYVSHYAKTGTLYFTIVGITYFMPNRVGFSLWFTFVAYQVYTMLGYGYSAPFHTGTITDHRNGAYLGMVIMLLWLGRLHWLAVIKAMFSPARHDDDRQNRTAGWVFTTGCAAMFLWQVWAGMDPVWALAFVLVAVAGCLVLTRIVAETGVPFVRNYFGPVDLLSYFPGRLTDTATIYLGGFLDFILTRASRVSAGVAFLHGLGLNREVKPQRRAWLAGLFLCVLLTGLVVCGAVHLKMGYHNSASLDGTRTPVAPWGSSQIHGVHQSLKSWDRGTTGKAAWSRPFHLTTGLALGVGSQLLCLISARWPLHPVGLLMVQTYYLNVMWWSVLLGWFVRMIILRFGGARSYRLMRPVFLGLIMGEVFSAILWAIVPAVLIFMGGNPSDVGYITILPG
ncbi:MAG: DUF6785 family protein [Lentisphaeria bacterium]|nr:DUF6785 family protein [Lentisphaeria bacterium]